MNDTNSLTHTRWNLQIPHRICAEIQKKNKRLEAGKILRMLCEWKKVKIVEAEVCPDHVHMLNRDPA